MHLISLHDSAGSNNPLGVSGNYDRVAFAPYFIFKLRRCGLMASLCKLQTSFSYGCNTLGLGTIWKDVLNRACLEKVETKGKRLLLLRSVQVDMDRVIQPEDQKPVHSNKGGYPSRIGISRNQVNPTFEGTHYEMDPMRCAKSIIKVLSGHPKSTRLLHKITTGSAKGSNPYADRGPGVAERYNTVYSRCNHLTRRSGPASVPSRLFSTGSGRSTNVLKRLESLSERAKLFDIKVDRNLYREFILNKDMYLIAYDRLKSNPGMMTPGINPTTLDGMSSEVLNGIIKSLASEEFKFTPGRRISIAKANGKTRPLTIGSPRDKLVQEVMRMVLEAIFEPCFKDTSHGFRPGRSCHSALKRIYSKFVGCTWWIEGDIKACFDSIPHDKLMNVLADKIIDQRLLQLVKKALNAGYLVGYRKETDIIGTPQGSIISPILANIYLHQLDVFVENLKEEFDSKSKSRLRTPEANKAKYLVYKAKRAGIPPGELRKLVVQYRNVENKRLGEHSNKIMYVRYADDWVIAVNGRYGDAEIILNKVSAFCNEIGLTISQEKTKITNAYKDKILFLGSYIKYGIQSLSLHSKGVKQRNRKQLLLTAPMNRIRDKLTKAGFISDNKAQTRVTWIPLTLRQIIQMTNSVIRGYLNYYSFVHNKGKLSSWMLYMLRDVAARTIARKLSFRTRAQVYKKFGMMLSVYDQTKRATDGSPKLVARIVKPNYRINPWNFKVKGTVNTNVPALYSNSISLASLDKLSCVVCESKYRVEMHHIRMMKDLVPKIHSLDYLMAKANRKQIALCRNCHMKYHDGKLTIQSKIEQSSSDLET